SLDELRAREFGDVEFFGARHSVEDRSRLIDDNEIEIDALGLHLAGVKRLHAVVEAARERKLQLSQLPASPGALEREVSLTMVARRRKTPIAGPPGAAHRPVIKQFLAAIGAC